MASAAAAEAGKDVHVDEQGSQEGVSSVVTAPEGVPAAAPDAAAATGTGGDGGAAAVVPPAVPPAGGSPTRGRGTSGKHRRGGGKGAVQVMPPSTGSGGSVAGGGGKRPNTVLTAKQRAHLDAVVRGSDPADVKISKLKELYVQQVKKTRRASSAYSTMNSHTKQLLHERDTLNKALESSQVMNKRLESLCRELQKQNGIVTAENKRIREEETKMRQELSERFNKSIEGIKKQIADDRTGQLEDTRKLQAQLQASLEQYELREKHFEKLLRTKELEKQLAEAQAAQALQAHKADLLAAQERDMVAKEIEKKLREQLALYGDKFKSFQETSSSVFETMKKDLTEANSERRRLQKLVTSLEGKTKKTDVALITMAEERNAAREHAATLTAQNKKLQGLCRMLQQQRSEAVAEVTALRAQLPAEAVADGAADDAADAAAEQDAGGADDAEGVTGGEES